MRAAFMLSKPGGIVAPAEAANAITNKVR